MEELFTKIYNEIDEMEDGFKTSIKNLINMFDDVSKYQFNEIMNLKEKLEDRCLENNIYLDYSKWDNSFVGIPYDLEFTKSILNSNTLKGLKILENSYKYTLENANNNDEKMKATRDYEEMKKILLDCNKYSNKIQKSEKELKAINKKWDKVILEYENKLNNLEQKKIKHEDNEQLKEMAKELVENDKKIDELIKKSESFNLNEFDNSFDNLMDKINSKMDELENKGEN